MSFGRARTRTLILIFLIAAALSAAAFHAFGFVAQRRATRLILQAEEARDTVSSLGTVVTRLPGPEGPVTTRARIHRGRGRAVIRYTDGPAKGRCITRDGRCVHRRGAGQAQPVTMETGAGAPTINARLLRKNYIARTLGIDAIAGREAKHVAIRRRSGNAGLHLWIDAKTSFPLRTITVDDDGRMLSDTRYETISYETGPPPITEESGQQECAGLRVQRSTAEEAGRAVGFTILRPAYLPPGFELDAYYIHRFRHRGSPGVQLRYVDGLAALSVIELPAPHARCGDRRNAGAASDRMPRRLRQAAGPLAGAVRRTHGDLTIITTGDLPLADLQRVADSVR